jgi:nucleotidyltransferase/DNA polymerase involved in DNA repair
MNGKKLSETEINDIRTLWAVHTIGFLAKRFKVNRKTIKRHTRGLE